MILHHLSTLSPPAPTPPYCMRASWSQAGKKKTRKCSTTLQTVTGTVVQDSGHGQLRFVLTFCQRTERILRGRGRNAVKAEREPPGITVRRPGPFRRPRKRTEEPLSLASVIPRRCTRVHGARPGRARACGWSRPSAAGKEKKKEAPRHLDLESCVARDPGRRRPTRRGDGLGS